MVEIALALPVLLILLVGVMKCGIVFSNWITLTEAVRVGGRMLSISRLDNPDACTDATTALRAAAVNLTQANLTVPTPTFPAPATSTCSNLIASDSATVTATYPCDLKILFYDFKPGCTLTSTITERIE